MCLLAFACLNTPPTAARPLGQSDCAIAKPPPLSPCPLPSSSLYYAPFARSSLAPKAYAVLPVTFGCYLNPTCMHARCWRPAPNAAATPQTYKVHVYTHGTPLPTSHVIILARPVAAHRSSQLLAPNASHASAPSAALHSQNTWRGAARAAARCPGPVGPAITSKQGCPCELLALQCVGRSRGVSQGWTANPLHWLV